MMPFIRFELDLSRGERVELVSDPQPRYFPGRIMHVFLVLFRVAWDNGQIQLGSAAVRTSR